LALVDEHVGEPAYAAIIGDPGATHPTSSPSKPDRRLSPRMTPPAGGGGPPALVLGFARLPEHRIAEAVRLPAEAAATRVGRAH
jgi:hypothetical protein